MNKNEVQLKIIGNKTDTKLQINLFDEYLSTKAVALLKEIEIIEENVGYDKLSYTGGNKKAYGFKNCKTLKKLTKDLHNKNMTVYKVEIKQNEFA